jgi:hypothetical protein
MAWPDADSQTPEQAINCDYVEERNGRDEQRLRSCDHRTLPAHRGPFYHRTKVALEVGDELAPGYGSNFRQGRVSNNIYFTGLLDTAVRGAELAAALAGSGDDERIYVVEPSGPFEDDPNVTNKEFPGNRPSPTAPATHCASSARWSAGRVTTPKS